MNNIEQIEKETKQLIDGIQAAFTSGKLTLSETIERLYTTMYEYGYKVGYLDGFDTAFDDGWDGGYAACIKENNESQS